MKAYKEYQNTEYDWLPEVPHHWKKRSIRTITKPSDARNGNRDDLELLSVYREYGVIKKASRDDNHNVESLNLSNYKYVGKDFLVMNKMKMWQGSLGVSNFEGIVSPAYIVCQFSIDANYRYLHYLLRSATFKTQYNRISYGIRVGQWDMRYSDFKNINLYLPPRPEQDQIVKFLDFKISKINKFIKYKKREIELLKVQKQAEINRAVTKGLNPNAAMKDSSIEWLGEIPKHWEVRRLKKCVTLINEKGSVNGENYIGLENIVSWTGKCIKTPTPVADGISNKFRKDDILFGKLRPYLAKSCIAEFDGVCSSELLVLRDFIGNNSYLQKLLITYDLISYINSSTYGAKMPRASWNFIGNCVIPLPPVDEQQSIINHLNKISKDIDNLILGIEQKISLTQEYKTSLLSEVVTGKVDVRDEKIDEIFEVETLDEIDSEVEAEEPMQE